MISDDPFNKNNMSDFSFTIQRRLMEDEENFIYETIEPFCSRVTQKKLSKKELARLLTVAERIEPFTYDEQCLFLAAISRERTICAKVMNEAATSENTLDLVKVCDEIERKVKKAFPGEWK